MEAGIASLHAGKTGYTANNGLIALRREISKYLERRFSLSYDPEAEVVCTVGGSEAIDLAIRAFLTPGDEFLVPEPAFVAYAPLAAVTGAKAVPLPTYKKDSFKVMQIVLPADNYEKADYTGKNANVNTVYSAGDAGYVVQVTESGSQGNIKLIVGIGPDGAVTGISILESNETSGMVPRAAFLTTKAASGKPDAAWNANAQKVLMSLGMMSLASVLETTSSTELSLWTSRRTRPSLVTSMTASSVTIQLTRL